jgi:hypothetical protein
MKKFIILFLTLSFHVQASISIVSDLDDTIKITNSGEEIDGAINALFTSKVFTGMVDFFSAADYYANDLHVLSASPQVLRPKITNLLNKKKINFKSLILKNSLQGESKFDYKVKAIKNILAQSSDDLILIGDDVGQDPEAYGEIQRLYPDRILAIYIHVIKNRSIAAGIKYWTSFDLFLFEYLAGRMSQGWVEHSAQQTFEESQFELIIPDFAHCPKQLEPWEWQQTTDFAQMAGFITNKIVKSCQVRNSSI